MVAKSIRNVVYGTWKDGSDVYKDKDGYYVIQWDPKKDALYNKYLAKSWKPIKYAPSRNKSKKTKTAKKAFKKLTTFGFAHDIEIINYLLKDKDEIKELPVTWSHVTNSKLNIFTDTFRMFIELFKIYKKINNA